MAFQILNVSIDTIEFTPIYSANCISYFNDFDSGIEYYSKMILGNKSCFPEYQKENTSKQSEQTGKQIIIKLFQPTVLSIIIKPCVNNILFAYPTDDAHRSLFIIDVIPEPPKA